MYGDVFGNRDPEVFGQDLGRESESRTPTETPTHVHRWQPVFEQERLTARYGYDPWTKSAFNLNNPRTRWWCWQWSNPVWHAALHYTVGSLLFVIASFAALFVTVRETPSLKRWLYAYPYMIGSINYTTGATILLYKSWLNHPSRMADPEDSVAPSHSGYLPAGGHVDGPVGFPRHNSPYLDREGHHTSTSSVYESTYETSTYDNVSRPPSFQSVKWWQGGEPDRELSQASMSTSVQPPTIAEQCSSSSLTLPSGPGNLPEPSRVATGGVDPPQAEESQDSVTVPLLGKHDLSAFNTSPSHGEFASHEPLLPQTTMPRHTFRPDLRIKTTPRSSRVTPRSSVAPTPPTDTTDANSLEAFGSRALTAVGPQQSDGAAEPSTANPSAATETDNTTEQQDTGTAQTHCSVAVAQTFTFSPGAFSGTDAPKVLEDEGSKSTHTCDTSQLGDSSAVSSPGQYPATPRTPRTIRGDEDNDHEPGHDDDRSTMISQPTDTQSIKSYYRVFGNRWTAVSTAEQQQDHEQQHLLSVQSRHPSQLNSLLRNYYRRDALYYIRADPWYSRRWLLDVSGSASIWAGAMLYNVSCTCLCYEAILGELPALFSNKTINDDILAYYPSTLGGVLFIVGSWLFWWAAHKTPLLWGPWVRLYTMEWWVTFLNLIGSSGFFYGAVTSSAMGEIQGLVPNWFELLIGYVIGSILFMIGSYLMVAELASHAAANAVLTL